MGLDCYAFAGIGFEIALEDFFQTVKASTTTCVHGHTKSKASKAKFCPEDGTKYECRETLIPTSAFVPLCTLLGETVLTADDFKDPDDLYDWWNEISCESEQVFAVFQGHNDESFLVCGSKFGSSGSHRNGTEIAEMSQEEIEAIFKQVGSLRESLGPTFADRPIKLYSWLYVSA